MKSCIENQSSSRADEKESMSSSSARTRKNVLPASTTDCLSLRHSHPSSSSSNSNSNSKHSSSPVRFWALFLISSLAAFLFLPSLSSTLLFSFPSLIRSFPSSSPDQDRSSKVEDDDFTLGGLLPDGSDTIRCMSRGLIHRYRSKSSHSPSPYLISKLRQYEDLHQRCGPGTESFKRASDLLRFGKEGKQGKNDEEECKYIVWIANSGLGNRLISIASAFVYALVTGRILLLDRKSDMSELLCEPFLGDVSWILPSGFEAMEMMDLNISSVHRYGLHLRQGTIMPSIRQAPEMDQKKLLTSTSISIPSSIFTYIHLMHDYDFYDKLFFCHEEQSSLHPIPWLFLKTNLYFLPSMYLYLPQFREELHLLFPDKEAVFHHISRYLFFPTNPVWSRITWFYDAYLSRASQIVGIQIRTFSFPPVVEPYLTKQILTCSTENGLLPNILTEKEWSMKPSRHSMNKNKKNKTAVLVTSLLPDYHEQMVAFYRDHQTETGEVVSLHQPSHEVHQNTEAHGHNQKAWAEMCLLSFSDKLITSPMSTFGYVAVGLAGIRPWMLARAEDGVVTSPVCSRVVSMDPCFHAPPYFKCDRNEGGDTSRILPYVKHCEDVNWGLKLFPSSES